MWEKICVYEGTHSLTHTLTKVQALAYTRTWSMYSFKLSLKRHSLRLKYTVIYNMSSCMCQNNCFVVAAADHTKDISTLHSVNSTVKNIKLSIKININEKINTCKITNNIFSFKTKNNLTGCIFIRKSLTSVIGPLCKTSRRRRSNTAVAATNTVRHTLKKRKTRLNRVHLNITGLKCRCDNYSFLKQELSSVNFISKIFWDTLCTDNFCIVYQHLIHPCITLNEILRSVYLNNYFNIRGNLENFPGLFLSKRPHRREHCPENDSCKVSPSTRMCHQAAVCHPIASCSVFNDLYDKAHGHMTLFLSTCSAIVVGTQEVGQSERLVRTFIYLITLERKTKSMI